MLCPSRADAAAHPAADLAIKQKKQEAINLLQEGENEKAYVSFMQLLREEPGDADVNMGIAITAYATGRYAQSLLAYERLLELFPADGNLRVQIARVYVALGETESARLELEKARQFDENLTDDAIADILAALTAKPSRWQFSGRISAGVLFDDNANQGPNSNYLTLGDFKDLYVEDVKKTSSVGNYLMAHLEAGYQLDEGGRWWGMGSIMGYQRWNHSGGVTSNKGYTMGRGTAGLRYLGEQSLFDVRFKADVANQHHKGAEDQDIHSYGPEFTFVIAPDSWLQLITVVSLEERDYSVSTMRDGFYWSATEYGRFFIGESNHEIMLGLGFSGNDADLYEYRYFAIEPSLRFVFKLPGDVNFMPFVSFRREDYKGPATGLEIENRLDKQWRAGAMVTWDISDSFMLDWSYQYVDNQSNSALYDYVQNYVSMGLTWKF